MSNNDSETNKKNKRGLLIAGISLIAVAVIGTVLYLVLSKIYVSNFGFTPEEFKAKYESSQMYTDVFQSSGFEIPVVYIEESQIPADNEFAMTSNDNINFFGGAIYNSLFDYDIVIQGHTRSVDNKIINLQVAIEYVQDENYSNFLTAYLVTYFQVLYPEETKENQIQMARDVIDVLLSSANSEYTVRGDYAYRLSASDQDGLQYFIFDVTTADNIPSNT